MELLFQETDTFAQDLEGLSDKDRTQIVDKINDSCALLAEDSTEFYKTVYKPVPLNLSDGLTSTLYALPITQDIRVILTVDEDVLFSQLIVTLFRAIPTLDLKEAFQSVAESLYESVLHAS